MANRTPSQSQIEPQELKKRDYDYAKVTRIMHLHNHHAKFRQNNYAKFRHLVVPLLQYILVHTGTYQDEKLILVHTGKYHIENHIP